MTDFSSSKVGDGPQVLVATQSEAMLDDVLRLSAAAGVTAMVASDPSAVRRFWSQAALVVVGDDMAGQLAPPASRRGAVVVVGRHEADADLFRWAVALGAEQVIALPAEEGWLVEQMGNAGDGRARAAVVVVVGCRGGAGASTLCAVLGRQAVAERLRSVLVDSDPDGADLDVMLDMADEPGLRWEDLAATTGRLPASPLAGALPRRDGLALLCSRDGRHADLSSAPRGDLDRFPAPEVAMTAVLGALVRGFDLVVVDVPRWLPPSARPVLDRADLVLLMTTADLRGVAAGRRVVAGLGDGGPPLRMVVRTGRSGSADPEQVARWMGVPLAARVPFDAKVAADGDRGDLIVRTSLRRSARAVLAELAEVAGGARRGTQR